MNFPTHDELIAFYQSGKATMPVNHINHREFVYNGIRYFCGYSSRRDENWKPDPKVKPWMQPEYKVEGWFTYREEPENATGRVSA